MNQQLSWRAIVGLEKQREYVEKHYPDYRIRTLPYPTTHSVAAAASVHGLAPLHLINSKKKRQAVAKNAVKYM